MIKGHTQNMSRFVIAIATAAALCVCAPAEASIVVTVDKSAQRLSVAIDGSPRYQWPVSTARWGYSTPNGIYRPERLARKWFSRKYDWSPMPYSIFFDGGYAIHGTTEVKHLGKPASHGCVRLDPANAKLFYEAVNTIGLTSSGPIFGPPGYEVNLLYIGALLALCLSHPSALSVDGWLSRRTRAT